MGRRRRRGPPQCWGCHRPIRWIRHRGRPWKFDPRPVDPRTHVGPPAYPVEADRAWHFPALVEELMGRRECSREDAEAEAKDMPWYVPHVCPGKRDNNDDDTTEGEPQQ